MYANGSSAARLQPGDHGTRAVAVVMGDLDLVRPLVMAGIRCVAATAPDSAARFSRIVARGLVLPPDSAEQELLTTLEAFSRHQPVRPVLFYETDSSMLLVSRNRERLRQSYRFVIDTADRLEACANKIAFAELAAARGLPVPPSQTLRPFRDGPSTAEQLDYPVMLKPHSHHDACWNSVGGGSKAVRVATPGDLGDLWPRLAATGQEFLVQAAIDGPETRIESYHAYIDQDGVTVAAFTGRKIRTLPRRFGRSTALEISHAPDVEALGADIVRRLGSRGALKLDFKRDAEDRLWLLEVNPRFTLWNHLGAVAGVNLPALVYADLTGTDRPPVRPARVGATWAHVSDVRAARASDVPLNRWLRWFATCDARSALAWDDPFLPLRVAAFRLAARLRSADGRMAPAPRPRSDIASGHAPTHPPAQG